jgi:hypothetical protein
MPSANGQQTAGTKWQWSEIRNDQDRHEEAAALMAGVREHWDKGRELWRSLRYEAAQLDLLVGRPVRDVATALVSAHDQAWFRMNPNGAGGDSVQARRREQDRQASQRAGGENTGRPRHRPPHRGR